MDVCSSHRAGVKGPGSVPTPVVGEALLHPAAIAAVLILLLNDHVLKACCPGAVTGKLSDVAGMAFFPLLLVTLADATMRVLRGRLGLTRRALVFCVVATGLVFGSAKTTRAGAQALGRASAVLQWPARAVAARHLVPVGQVNVAQDPTDLVALPALLVAYWVGRRAILRTDRAQSTGPTHSTREGRHR